MACSVPTRCATFVCIPIVSCLALSFGPFQDAPYATNIVSKTYSTAAFGDCNNDGFIDIAATDCDGAGACNLGNLHVYRNDPLNPGRFSHQTVLSSSVGPARQLAWGDFDNDGDLDLYANGGGTGGHQYLLQNQGEAGGYALVVAGGGTNSDNVLPSNQNVQGAGWLDVNQDGWLDLFVSNGTGGSSKLYLNKGKQSLSNPNWFNLSNATNWFTKFEQTAWASGEASRNGSYSTFGDFDNDTRQDIFYAVDEEGTRRVFVWHNETTRQASTFHFTEMGQTVLNPPTSGTADRISWTGIVTWDPDNDGDMDMTVGWANHLDNYTATPQFYENTGTYAPISSLSGLFQGRSKPWTQHKTYTGGVAFADAYNNGLLDLYLAHSSYTGGESHKFYRNDGSLNFTEIETGISHTSWAAGATFGDIDNDGDADLFLCNGGRLMVNTTNSNNVPAHPDDRYYKTHGFYEPSGPNAEHYLDVMIVGAGADSTATTKTKDGIGARVYLFLQTDTTDNDTIWSDYGAGQLVAMREIDGGSGYGSQATQVQHFGLPTTLPGGKTTDDPHLEYYAVKVLFLTGEVFGKKKIIPEYVEVKIPYNNKQDTTFLAQTVEIWLGEKYIPPIAEVRIDAEPDVATITTSQRQTYTGTVFVRNQDGSITEAGPVYDGLIQWSLAEPSGLTPGASSLSPTSGKTTTFGCTDAYLPNGTNPVFTITASVVNPEDPGDIATEQVQVTVVPGDAAQLSIEASPSKPTIHAALISPNPINSVTLSKTETDTNVYAIHRDQYGNWIGPADAPAWASLNASVATVSAGALTSSGQGHVARVVNRGSTRGYAVKGTLTDTIDIYLEDVTYDQLRIVNASGAVLTTLTMRTDQDTILYAEGLNSATQNWERIIVSWSQTGLSIDPANPIPTGQTQFWHVYPDGSGTGTITITKSGVSASIQVTFQKGPPARLVLYPAAGQPDVGANLPLPSGVIYDTAGQTMPLYAKIFDHNGEWLSLYETDANYAAYIGWDVTDDENVDRSSYLNTTSGNAVQFSATRAHHTYEIVAVFEDSVGNKHADTAIVFIRPGAASKLVIEGDPDARTKFPNEPNEKTKVTLTSTILDQSVYAILRDQYDNFVAYSTGNTWTSGNTAYASVAERNNAVGEGVITKGASVGNTTVRATSKQYPSLWDEVPVEVKNYSYTQLQILSGAGAAIDSLVMTTNDDTLLQVRGLRDDGFGWEDVDADWEISAGLQIAPAPPKSAHVYGQPVRFSPASPATGWIRVTMAMDATIIPDTVLAFFTAGPPLSMEFEILTPAAQRIAGQRISAAVRIKNKNGLVPGIWCYPGSSPDSAVYTDALGSGGRPNPTVTVTKTVVDATTSTDTTELLNVGGSTQNEMKECFYNGSDTVTFVLFYAPLDQDSLHKLTVMLGSLSASATLRLLPGPLDSLALKDIGGNDLDTVNLTAPDGALTVVAIGYDAYGNYLGPVNSNWSVTDSLHAPSRANNTSQIYYAATFVEHDEAGHLIACAADTSRDTICDNIWIAIKGPLPRLDSAITRDYNGNGYLDAIELTFNRKLSFPDSFPLTNIYISYSYKGTNVVLPVTSIVPAPGGGDTTHFVLYLSENTVSVPGVPQTGWVPSISIGGLDDAEPISAVVMHDGAAPVIWDIVKRVSSTSERSRDRVTVTFSEDVFGPNASPVQFSNTPEALFNVWRTEYGDTVADSSMFAGIATLSEVGSDYVVFFMTNGENLTANNLLSLRTDTLLLGDKFENTPNPNNQKVRVRVEGAIGPIHVGPNPMYPTFQHFEERLANHEPQEAYEWAKRDGGAVMVAELLLPDKTTAPTYAADATMIVFDAVGNMVYSIESEGNVIPGEWLEERMGSEVHQLVFYWNGITSDRRKAAPGIYRVVIYLDTKTEQEKFTGNVGIGR